MKRLICFLLAIVILASFSLVSITVGARVIEYKGGSISLTPDIFTSDDDALYLYRENGPIDSVKGAKYDAKTNTLTFNGINYADKALYLREIKSGINIKIYGNCKIGAILVENYEDYFKLGLSGTGTLNLDSLPILEGIYITTGKEGTSVTVGKKLSLNITCSTSPIYFRGMAPSDKCKFIVGGKEMKLSQDVEKSTLYKSVYAVPGVTRKTPFRERVISKKDPKGIYSARKKTVTTYTNEKIVNEELLVVEKYIYSKELEVYIDDPDYNIEGFENEEEMNKAGYSYNIVKSEAADSVYVYKPDSSSTNNTMYAINNPDDPDGTYVITKEIFRDRTKDEFVYSVGKLRYDEEQKKYIRDNFDNLTITEFEQQGYHYVMKDDGTPKGISYYFNGGSSNGYGYEAVNDNDPDGLYVVGGTYAYGYPETMKFSIYKTVYNEETKHYEYANYGDKDAVAYDTVTAQEFTDKGYTYKYSDVHEKLRINYGVLDYYSVYLDENGKEVAVRSDTVNFLGADRRYYYIYDLSDTKTATYKGKTVTILPFNYTGKTSITDMERVKEETSNYSVTYPSENFTFKGTGAVSLSKCKASVKNAVFTGKALKPSVTVKYGKTKLKNGVDYTLKYKNNKKVGKASVTITGKYEYKGKIVKTFKITKAENTVKVTTKKAVTAKANKASTIKKAVIVRKAQGKVTYTTNNKKVTVKKGAITVAKGFKKGKTIKVKITVTAKGNGNYKSKKVVKTVKIRIR